MPGQAQGGAQAVLDGRPVERQAFAGTENEEGSGRVARGGKGDGIAELVALPVQGFGVEEEVLDARGFVRRGQAGSGGGVVACGLGVAQAGHGQFGTLRVGSGRLHGAAVEVAFLQREDVGKQGVGKGEVGLLQGEMQAGSQDRGFGAVTGGGGGLGEEVAMAGCDFQQAGGNGVGLDASLAEDAEEAEHLFLRGTETAFQGRDGGCLFGVQAGERGVGGGEDVREQVRRDAVNVTAGRDGAVVGKDVWPGTEHAGVRASGEARN